MQGKSRNASNPKELHQFPRNSIETLKHWMTGRAVQPMHVSHLLFEEITYLRVLPLDTSTRFLRWVSNTLCLVLPLHKPSRMVAELPLHFCPSLNLSSPFAPWTTHQSMALTQEMFNTHLHHIQPNKFSATLMASRCCHSQWPRALRRCRRHARLQRASRMSPLRSRGQCPTRPCPPR